MPYLLNCDVYGRGQKVYVHLMRKFPNNTKIKVSGCFKLISKKGHGRLITVATLVLPLGLGKFGHALEIDHPHRCGNEAFALPFRKFQPHSFSEICVCDQHFLCATKFQKIFATLGQSKVLLAQFH